MVNQSAASASRVHLCCTYRRGLMHPRHKAVSSVFAVGPPIASPSLPALPRALPFILVFRGAPTHGRIKMKFRRAETIESISPFHLTPRDRGRVIARELHGCHDRPVINCPVAVTAVRPSNALASLLFPRLRYPAN